MRLGASGFAASGLWEPKEHRIGIKRSELLCVEPYAGTLHRGAARAVSGTPDVSAGFEDALTAETGALAKAVGRPR